jgi:transcriptional regulator with XRE-family HTH domain
MQLRIKELLKEKNMQVIELAGLIKLSPQNLSKLINEKTKPSIETFERIATALSVPISDLFSEPSPDVIACPYCGGKIKVSKDEPAELK